MEFQKVMKRGPRDKILFIALILGAVFALTSFYFAYQHMGKIQDQRLEHIRQTVQIARNAINPILAEYEKGEITGAEALEQIRGLVREMTYKDHDGENYIFMSSYEGTMLVQPFEPEKEMTNTWDLQDYNGKYIIRSLVNAARSEEGQGYVSYYYQRPGQISPEEKISFVIGIPELGCYIGTGQYLGDLKKSQSVYLLKTTFLIFILLLLLFLLVRLSIREIALQNTKLKSAERELSAIFNNTFQLIGRLTPEGRLTKANSTALRFIDREASDVIGRFFWDTPWWEGDGAVKQLKNAVKKCSKGEFCRFEASHTSFDGVKHYMDFSLTPLQDEAGQVTTILAEGRDISELKQIEEEKMKLEEMLFQSQKMEAIGTLAGGIAHDFNNILTSVLGYAELVQNVFSPEDPHWEMQEQVITAAVRAKELIQQILLFSRQSEYHLKPIEPHLVIEDALKLLRSSIPSTIEIKKNIPANLGTIQADAIRLHQVIMNLCTNSFHAMKESGGVLSVSLYEKDMLWDDRVPGEDGTQQKGNYLCLEIGDTGPGMDKVLLDKVFNPYFTTKPKGEGTGLGLSVVHGIVKNFGGEIKMDSQSGVGTRVYITLPRMGTKGKAESEKKASELREGTERIMLIDDDSSVLEMTDMSLSSLGYRVEAFSDCREGLNEFKENSSDYDLVITDLTMPHMTGLELSRILFRINPDIPIILCTGYSDHITMEKAEEMGIRALLTKPIRRERLAETIRGVLSRE